MRRRALIGGQSSRLCSLPGLLTRDSDRSQGVGSSGDGRHGDRRRESMGAGASPAAAVAAGAGKGRGGVAAAADKEVVTMEGGGSPAVGGRRRPSTIS